jgi:recombination endonuclease VII
MTGRKGFPGHPHRKGKPLTLEEILKSSLLTQKRANLNFRKTRYGLEYEDYQRMLKLQGDACAICRVPFDDKIGGKRPCVDHEHTTNRVRGILCHGCNLKLAAVDNIDWLEKAFDYIQRWL